MIIVAKRPPLISLIQFVTERFAMAAGHLKRGPGGHLLRKSSGHLVNDCAAVDPCTYCVFTPAPDIASVPTSCAIQNYNDPIFDWRPCDYDDPSLPYWDGIFINPTMDGAFLGYFGTDKRVKGMGGVGLNSSAYPYSLLTYNPFCGVWGIGMAEDSWVGCKLGPSPLGTYKFCYAGVSCAPGPATVTLI